MKKKSIFIPLFLLLGVLSLSSCGLDEFLNPNNPTPHNPTPTDPTDPTNPGEDPTTPQEETYYNFVKFSIVWPKVEYEVGDVFINPTVIGILEDGTEIDVTGICTFSGIDMSVAGTQKLTIQLTYKIDKIRVKTATLTSSVNVKPRRDYHVDPEEDEDIETLEISNVRRYYYIDDYFEKPNVFAIHKNGNRDNVSSEATFEGFDSTSMGIKEILVTYGSHTLTYDVTVNDVNADPEYPMVQISYFLNTYKYTAVVGETYQVYLMSKNNDGTKEKFDYVHQQLSGVTFEIDDEEIATVNESGYITSLKAGKTFVIVTLPYDSSDGQKFAKFKTELIVEERVLTDLYVETYKSTYYSGHSLNFAGKIYAVYQTGYKELINPNINLDGVDINNPGTYPITLSYTLNGITKETNVNVEIVSSEDYEVDKIEMKYEINDELASVGLANALPHKGDLKILVIPVKFSDSDLYISNYSNVREDIEKSFFGTNEEVGWRSVKTYYEEESHNQITYNGTVSEWYNTNKPTNYYFNQIHLTELRDEALEWYFSTHPEEDIKSYDVDHNGLFDSLNLIYGAPDYTLKDYGEEGSGQLWAKVVSSSYTGADIENPISRRFLWASYDFMYPSKSYALERTEQSDYTNPGRWYDKKNVTLVTTTFIHETGHMFGINDYYSYTDSTKYYAGNANMQTSNIIGHDPYSLLLYNWAKPYVPEINTTITIGDFQTTHDCILLTPNWNTIDSPFDEYFLLDLYVGNSGLNYFHSQVDKYVGGEGGKVQDIDTVGVRIWHVDARLATISSNYATITNDPKSEAALLVTDNSIGNVTTEGLINYDKFVELQLVRNDVNYKFDDASYLRHDQYFRDGDIFTMEKYASQFVNEGKLDSGLDLGWSVEILGIYNSDSGYVADIKLTRI